jgi:hypothetical protein
VVVHILEDDMVVEFLKDVAGSLAPGGHFLYSILNAEFQLSTGRREWVGENSCVRTFETQRGYAHRAGLEIVDAVGTYVEPWALRDLEFLAQESSLRDDPGLYAPFEQLGGLLRGRNLTPFSEVLLVTRVAGTRS